MGRTNEATLANPVLPQSDTGFFRARNEASGFRLQGSGLAPPEV